MKRTVLILSLIIFATSCLCSPASFLVKKTSIPPTPEPDVVLPSSPSALVLPSIIETEPPLENATPTDLPSTDTSAPRLVLLVDDTLWITDENGNDLSPLLESVVISQPLSTLIQPNGHVIAVIQKIDTTYRLVLVDLFDSSVKLIENLAEDLPLDTIGTPDFEALRAITEQPSIAWRADGAELAYVSTRKGSGADLFLYKVTAGSSTSLENDIYQTVQPSWNGDGTYLAYLTVEAFGTGAGYSMNSLWNYHPGDSEPVKLDDLTSSSGEDILGWGSENQLILQSWNPMCGNNSLRRITVPDGKTEMIRKECFTSAAVSDTGSILYGTGEHAWYVPPGQKKGSVIEDGNMYQIKWLPTDSIFQVYREEMPLLSLDRLGKDKQTAPVNGIDQVTMYGAIWAWTDLDGEAPGVWTSGMGLTTQKVFEGPAYQPIWTPHNDLLFISENQLYRASFLSYSDAAPIGNLPGTVLDSAWAQFDIY